MAASLSHVTKTYGAGTLAVSAANDASLDILANRFTVLSGPSGSGKTTLLNLLGGIDRPTRGTISVAGQRIDTMSENVLADFRARHVGFVFQSFNLLPVLSAFENVEYPLTLLGVTRARRREQVLSLLDAVGMDDKADRRPGQLSGGQQQRVAIARALVTEPALVLADEPTANLDSATGAAIIRLMRAMQRERATSFVFSSHDPQVIAAADDVAMIRDGHVVDTRSVAPRDEVRQ
ncbi:ABC transporter [Burkholderia ubonensis]|uniref:ABC transporter ATP-binding protein n=1 Tax=Burkholderia ubonensis TaxID=101571 RepID=UPI000758C9BF|nr:ABC transporter [Burkholderia ubonensis]KWK56469.1 ABC transporter [Burkholderia ubonensis]RQS12253.1 ABC transporter ATP-binding protein [Burkholderia sp. Bp9002]